MKQRIFIVHGWAATPDMEWFPWLKNQLEKEGFEVSIPPMPDTDHPTMDAWIGMLQEAVGEVRSTDIFIGHSIGCQTILRYLQHPQRPIKGLVCVAGWFTLKNLESEEEELIAKPWLDTPIDLDAVHRVAGFVAAIFSDTDPYVPLDENRDIFKQRLGARIIVEHDKGHFSEDNDIYELPIVLDIILELTGK